MRECAMNQRSAICCAAAARRDKGSSAKRAKRERSQKKTAVIVDAPRGTRSDDALQETFRQPSSILPRRSY